MNLRERIGLNIQNLRRSKQLSQEHLAYISNIDRSYISAIELAKSSVSVDKLEQLAAALEVDASVLVRGRSSSNKCDHEE
ncbi:helix-turn-helix domain-containing protein [Sulfitobacter mediterraneus]|uniref:helix-turn-helix domain-containing protein n=1 Tax=Sulfitobacter mediterraneus TaxID=83219 RepID=UPI0021A78AE1|nr:helix-turn-helix transcriptional regulator [Sulfitobacter mediterraneus]UWR10336.1 helix-turn-helix domain-containing protein [Sulfitobacter mediterraneus]